MKQFAVYIMGNSRPTLYVGVTNDIFRRVSGHKSDQNEGFTKKYQLHKLLYFEVGENSTDAIIREKQIKNMSRKEKLEIIEERNPNFEDLFPKLFDCSSDPDSGQAGMTIQKKFLSDSDSKGMTSLSSFIKK